MKRDLTLPRLVPNQMSRERVVGRGRGGEMAVRFREGSNVALSVKAQLGVGGGGAEQGGFKAEQDRDVVGAGRGEGVRPFCERRCKERAGKG